MPEPGKRFDVIAYRVQGERPDGTTRTRDYLQMGKAEREAEKMRRAHTAVRDGQTITLPALRNVRITPSAPIRWKYKDPALARGPEDL